MSVSAEERDLIQDAARRAGLPVAAWIRTVCLQAAGK